MSPIGSVKGIKVKEPLRSWKDRFRIRIVGFKFRVEVRNRKWASGIRPPKRKGPTTVTWRTTGQNPVSDPYKGI